jgi:thiol-disulfide isomerase/thioredoxin
MLGALLLSVTWAAEPSVVVVTAPGIDDDCCAQKVVALLDALPFVGSAGADPALKQACGVLSGTYDGAALAEALTAGGYPPTSAVLADACPAGTQPRVDPWDDVGALDARVISRGETVDLAAHRSDKAFTLYDFGAPWCGPCITSAARLKAYMGQHADVALRAVVLEGADARASFAQPIVTQHLQWAQGLPWFLVHDRAGRKVYEGASVEAALSAVDKRRARGGR